MRTGTDSERSSPATASADTGSAYTASTRHSPSIAPSSVARDHKANSKQHSRERPGSLRTLRFHDDDRYVVARAVLERRRNQGGGALAHVAPAEQCGDPIVVQLASQAVRAQQIAVARAHALAADVEQQCIFAAHCSGNRMIGPLRRFLDVQFPRPGMIARQAL